MKKWEYHIELVASEKRFNELGAEGWELVSSAMMQGSIFKRELK